MFNVEQCLEKISNCVNRFITLSSNKVSIKPKKYGQMYEVHITHPLVNTAMVIVDVINNQEGLETVLCLIDSLKTSLEPFVDKDESYAHLQLDLANIYEFLYMFSKVELINELYKEAVGSGDYLC